MLASSAKFRAALVYAKLPEEIPIGTQAVRAAGTQKSYFDDFQTINQSQIADPPLAGSADLHWEVESGVPKTRSKEKLCCWQVLRRDCSPLVQATYRVGI